MSSPDVSANAVTQEYLRSVPRDFAREHLVLSQGDDEGREILAVSSETHPAAIYNVGVRLRRPVRPEVHDGEAIAKGIDDAYGLSNPETQDLEAPTLPEDPEALLEEMDRDLLNTRGKGPVVKLVDAILFEATVRNASDVHIQPLDGKALIRYRVDGTLHTVREIPLHITTSLISRIKVMGRMDIAERRTAQDGRSTVMVGSRAIDLRISTFPTNYGERAVLRLLDNREPSCGFDSLGMPDPIARTFLACAERPNGIVLVTGPTGSGKTTTLYATLSRIASTQLNIMTIEDPIEYDLSSSGVVISQAQVNSRKGVTFATGLRHILRQDPDVILVGEIRDIETARMAIQSSLTGHLVFSTLHTNDAPSAVTRLIDLGVEPYLVSSSLSAVLAQRLVRLKHLECEGQGCETCFGSGLLGRTGIFELLVLDEDVRQLICEGAGLSKLRRAAIDKGMRTLFDDGQRLVQEGLTTQTEVGRVTQEIV